MGRLQVLAAMALGGSPIESRSHGDLTSDTCNTPGYQCSADCHYLQLCVQLGPSYQLTNVLTCTSDGLYCDVVRRSCSDSADVCQVVVPFKCNMAGKFPDPQDCTLYHVCEDEGGQGTALYCDSGYAFDTLSGACDISTDDIVCTDGPVPECMYPGQTGTLERNPAIYYICSGEGPMLFICPQGQYNPSLYSCQIMSVNTDSSDTGSETANTDSEIANKDSLDTSSETANTDSSVTYSETTNTDSETANTDSSITGSETANTGSSDTDSETTNTDSETTNTYSSVISSETANTDSSVISSETANTDSSVTSSETANTDSSVTYSETTNTDSETANTDSSVTSSETANTDSSVTSSETTNTDSSVTSSETANTDSSVTISETTNTDSSVTSSETANTDSSATDSETTNTDSSVTSSETANTDSSVTYSETTNTDSSVTYSETTNTDSETATESETTSQGTTAAPDTCSTAGYACSADCNRVELCLDTGTSLDLIVMTKCVKGQTSCNLSLRSCTSISDCHPVIPFKCNMQGVFPDPYNCTLYHYCANREAIPVTTRCGEGLAYDASTYACDLSVTSSVCRSNQVPECTRIVYLTNKKS
uniref:Chitin-binding type-2 domain-containing protein n=1 Tax=Timema bartmani TaxID=61472 RepID=A0A7R9F5Q8_9NEOP|nr:unnamed protein product [Timema bartmani]